MVVLMFVTDVQTAGVFAEYMSTVEIRLSDTRSPVTL